LVREALSGRQTAALFSVAFLAVLREGIELGWIPSVVEPVYDLNPIVPEASTAGGS
jgi:hypothetical protein